MRQFLFFCLTTSIAFTPAKASLGDDDDRIDNTYGNLVERHLRDDGTVSMLYHKDRYLCLVIFDRLRSVCEMYCRIDGHDLSSREISRFLKANGAHATWSRVDSSAVPKFERSDHKAEAQYEEVRDRPTLIVRQLQGAR